VLPDTTTFNALADDILHPSTTSYKLILPLFFIVYSASNGAILLATVPEVIEIFGVSQCHAPHIPIDRYYTHYCGPSRIDFLGVI
jgi:hypothetical protein